MLENEKNKLKQVENESRIDNLKEFVNALSEFENLDEFLEHVGLVNEKISTLVSELKNLPISEVLGSVKKSHSRKYYRIHFSRDSRGIKKLVT